jgi:hypothetical protein
MENIINNFLNLLKNGTNRGLSSVFLDRNNKIQSEAITFDDLFENSGSGDSMNFFPSDRKGACHNVAMFVSFHKPIFDIKFKRDQMISLDVVLKKVVQQVLGTCYPINKKIVLITDKVDTEIFEPWIGNLKAMKKMGLEIEVVYLKSNGDYELINTLLAI